MCCTGTEETRSGKLAFLFIDLSVHRFLSVPSIQVESVTPRSTMRSTPEQITRLRARRQNEVFAYIVSSTRLRSCHNPYFSP
jgi:hypothetical protein